MTYNSCPTFKWNNGVSFPIGSGHGCIGCSENNFWDNGPFYKRLSGVPFPGIESTAEDIGKVAAVAAGVGVAAHAASWVGARALHHAKAKKTESHDEDKE
jgi:hydrogenase small subunit